MDVFHKQRIAAKLLAAITLVMTAIVAPLPTMPIAVHATTCANDSTHWYAQSSSGYSNSVVGTWINTTAPASWYVDQSANSTTDEAAWLIDYSSQTNAVEAGFYSGFWPYGGGFTSALVPYYTTDNGANGWRDTSNSIPAGASVAINIFDNGSGTTINSYHAAWHPSYSVSLPRWNYAQGEVTSSTNTWMGGGTGEQLRGYWTADGSNWAGWGYHNDCNNSPYFVTSQGANTWTNGGK